MFGGAGRSGSFAALRATVTHGDSVSRGFFGSSWSGLSAVFTALGTEVVTWMFSGAGFLPEGLMASALPIANSVTIGEIF